MSKLAYEYTNEELVDAFGEATAEAAVAWSGLIVDITADFRRTEYRYLRGVLLSRIDHLNPPATRGEKMLFKPGVKEVTSLNRASGYQRNHVRKEDLPITVVRTWYEGNGTWSFSFDNEGYRYPASQFESERAVEARRIAAEEEVRVRHRETVNRNSVDIGD